MKLYVSGPMTGIAEFNYPAFEAATVALRGLGYHVISPHEVNAADLPEQEWSWYLRRDIVALVEAEAIVLLPGHADSKGSKLERFIGEALGMPVYELAELVPA